MRSITDHTLSAGRSSQPRKGRPRSLISLFVILMFSGQSLSTTIPPSPSLSDISGTWLAIRSTGDVCRLDIDAENGTGEMVCTIGQALFRAAIQDVTLTHLQLSVEFEDTESLDGRVVYERFEATYGVKQIIFIKVSRLQAALTQLGGKLSLGDAAPQ